MWKRMRDRLPAVAAGLLFVAAPLGAMPTMAAAAKPATYSVPLRAFIVDYVKAAPAGHYQPQLRFDLPAAWFYAPDGRLMTIATQHTGLGQLGSTFPPAHPRPMANQPSLSSLLGTLGAAGGLAPSRAPAVPPGKWTMVLLEMDESTCVRESGCAKFMDSVHALAKRQGAALDTVTVTLTH